MHVTVRHRRDPARRNRHAGQRGSALLLMTAFLMTLLTMSAFVIDLGFRRQLVRQAQGAVDAAALAAAAELPTTASDPATLTKQANARQTAANFVADDLSDGGALSASSCTQVDTATCQYTIGSTTVTVTTPYALENSAIAAWRLIYVRVCAPAPTFLAKSVGATPGTYCRKAVARRIPFANGRPRGMISLNETACAAFLLSGSSYTDLVLDAAGGAVVIDSNCPTNALDGGGNAWDLDASGIYIDGGYDLSPCTIDTCLNGVEPTTANPRSGDPFAEMPEPPKPAVDGGCSANRCTPGYYASGLKFSGGTDFQLDPGIYWIDGGLSSSGSAAVRATANQPGVMFFVASGSVDLTGGGALVLPPATSGTYQGITIFQARCDLDDAEPAGTDPPCDRSAAKINGNDDSQIGTVYLRDAALEMQGNAGQSSPVFVTGTVIADTMKISGNGYLRIKAVETPNMRVADPDIGLER
ncbi:MAG: hypothetical protein HYX34_02955 [Actinobacteria bacterium]|nr:hypothetical protein [Actinomycetota bacterium]